MAEVIENTENTENTEVQKNGNAMLRLPYAIAKNRGLSTDGMTPRQVWEMLRGRGISKEAEEKKFLDSQKTGIKDEPRDEPEQFFEEPKKKRSTEPNKFKKYFPNVWLAESDDEYEKGEIIDIETQYGKVVEAEVHNLIYKNGEGKYFYSIVRLDEPYAQRKADKWNNSAVSHATKSNERYQSAQQGSGFLSLGEPIKVGHHSEKGHRALLERNNSRMAKSIEEQGKAEEAARKAEYWEKRAEQITLANPESLEYFKAKLAKATDYHKKMKSGEIPQNHGYSLIYAKNEVNDLTKKLEIARKLWGE